MPYSSPVLLKKYYSTFTAVLRYFLGSTETIPNRVKQKVTTFSEKIYHLHAVITSMFHLLYKQQETIRL